MILVSFPGVLTFWSLSISATGQRESKAFWMSSSC